MQTGKSRLHNVKYPNQVAWVTLAGSKLFSFPSFLLSLPASVAARCARSAQAFLIRFAHKKARRGGADRDRTDDLKLAKLPLSQLSYGPVVLKLIRPARIRSQGASFCKLANAR